MIPISCNKLCLIEHQENQFNTLCQQGCCCVFWPDEFRPAGLDCSWPLEKRAASRSLKENTCSLGILRLQVDECSLHPGVGVQSGRQGGWSSVCVPWLVLHGPGKAHRHQFHEEGSFCADCFHVHEVCKTGCRQYHQCCGWRGGQVGARGVLQGQQGDRARGCQAWWPCWDAG